MKNLGKVLIYEKGQSYFLDNYIEKEWDNLNALIEGYFLVHDKDKNTWELGVDTNCGRTFNTYYITEKSGKAILQRCKEAKKYGWIDEIMVSKNVSIYCWYNNHPDTYKDIKGEGLLLHRGGGNYYYADSKKEVSHA
ncbi:MAG: hypothetical protein ACOCXH_04455 [Cyclobacteriaceae bacterium]